MTHEELADVRASGPKTIEEAVEYLKPIARSAAVSGYATALNIVIDAALNMNAAAMDLERLLWTKGGPCAYCAKDKGKGGHSRLDRPCVPCEPKWRGRTQKKEENRE